MSRIHILKGFSDVDSALWVLKYHPGPQSRSDLVQKVRDNGYTVPNEDYEVILLLIEWGLVLCKRQELTQKGEEFYSLWEMKRDVAIDVLHGLQYLAGWSYREVCNYLWDSDTIPMQEDVIRHIYDRLSDRTEHQGNAAFDAKSVNRRFRVPVGRYH